MANNRVVPFNVEYTKTYLIDWKNTHKAPSMQWISRVIVRRSERYLESCFTRGMIGVDDLNRICKNTGLDRNKALDVETDNAGRERIASEKNCDQITIASELAHINRTLEEILEFIKEAWN